MNKKPSGRPKPGFSSRGASRGGRTDNRRPFKPKPITPNRTHGFSGGERPYDYAYYEKEPATPEYLDRLFRQHDFILEKGVLKQFWRYYELLSMRNAELDLTRIMGIEATVLKHFVDSIIVLRHLELRSPLLDIGTGPGFPGAPIAIMRPDLKVILAESRGKRVKFLEELVKELGLKNVVIWPHSVREDSPFGPESGEPVTDIITRALETITPTLVRVKRFQPAGGVVAFMKGPQCGQEITEAHAAMKGIYKMSADVKYDLPGTDQHRRLVAFERRPSVQ